MSCRKVFGNQPVKAEVPDYYDLIEDPIWVSGMTTFAHHGEYDSDKGGMDLLEKHLTLFEKNAKRYSVGDPSVGQKPSVYGALWAYQLALEFCANMREKLGLPHSGVVAGDEEEATPDTENTSTEPTAERASKVPRTDDGGPQGGSGPPTSRMLEDQRFKVHLAPSARGSLDVKSLQETFEGIFIRACLGLRSAGETTGKAARLASVPQALCNAAVIDKPADHWEDFLFVQVAPSGAWRRLKDVMTAAHKCGLMRRSTGAYVKAGSDVPSDMLLNDFIVLPEACVERIPAPRIRGDSVMDRALAPMVHARALEMGYTPERIRQLLAERRDEREAQTNDTRCAVRSLHVHC